MKTLSLHDVDSSDSLVWPEDFAEIDLHAPALTLLTDFHRHEPLVVNGDMHASEAERLLRQSHVGMKLVGSSRGEFIGTVSRDALSEANRIKRIAAGFEPADLRVRDMMTPRHQIQAIDLDALGSACVGDIVETLRFHGQRHCLVVDPAQHHICGLIAASDIARRLHVNLDVDGPPTFAQIHDAVGH